MKETQLFKINKVAETREQWYRPKGDLKKIAWQRKEI